MASLETNKAFEGYGTTVTETSPTGAAYTASPGMAPETEDQAVGEGLRSLEAQSVHWYSYLKTWDFWLVVLVGQVLSLCITGTNTFTTFLAENGTNIPAFQTLFNYALLSLIYVPLTFYYKGWRYVLHTVLLRDGWKYFILSFLDVEGNYFTVLAYEYTNILSAQLLNFWSIVCVVILSFLLLRVRYRPFQIIGILVACGGMGLLLASDHITGSNGGPTVDKLKGDLFGLLGASLYGISNVFEEWFVSRRPAYEVLACLGFFGVCINGVQAAIFDRTSIQHAAWHGAIAGYLVGYTLILALFYTLAPLILRMGSAAFFDISLLTANFWGVIIGIHVFGYSVHFLYPIAFVLILLCLAVYFLSGSLLGDAKKPWLGANQEDGVAGFGTAKLKALNAAKKQHAIEESAAAAETHQDV